MRRSFSGPLLLLAIGALFLWRNLHPDAPVFEILAQYWPFVLIAWGCLRLIEALVWRNDRVRGSFSGGEVVLIIMICIVGSGIWTAREHGVRFMAGGLDFWGQQYDYPVSATASASGMKRIVFENSHGNFKVTGGDSKEITVTGHKLIRAYNREDADRTNGNTPVEIVPQGDRLVVRTNQDRVPNNQRISCDIEVTVPRGLAVESRTYRRPPGERRWRRQNQQQPPTYGFPGGRQCAHGYQPQRPDPRHGHQGADRFAGPRLRCGTGEYRGAGDHQRRVQRHARFQEPLQTAAVRRDARHGIERAGGAGTDQHGPGRVQR